MADPTGPQLFEAAVAGGGTSGSVRPVRVERVDGSIVWIDSNTGRLIFIEQLGTPETKAAYDAKNAPTPRSPVVREWPDGSLRQYNYATSQWDLLALPPISQPPSKQLSGTGTSSPTATIFDPATGTLTSAPNPSYAPPPRPTEADLLQQQLQIQQAQQNLIPPMSLMYTQMMEAIKLVESKIAAGEITPDEGTAYIDGLRQQFDAALRGATPFQEQQGKLAQRNIERNLGWDILNQNAQRSTSLAASLMGTAGSMAQNTMMPAGKTSLGVDPLAIARAYAEQAGGGQQMSNFARSLLMGAQGQAEAPQMQQQYPTTREAVLTMYPELGRG